MTIERLENGIYTHSGMADEAIPIFPRFDGNGIKKILVPTNFLESSDTALQLAIDLARQQDARISLLHILRRGDGDDTLRRMHDQIARIPEADHVEIDPVIRRGKVYQEILNEETRENPDLIIMSRKHREKESLFDLIRSTTSKIRRRAHCSVLVVGA